jgi:hypothetical protein
LCSKIIYGLQKKQLDPSLVVSEMAEWAAAEVAV